MKADIPNEYGRQLDSADEFFAKDVPFSAFVSLGAILATVGRASGGLREHLEEEVAHRIGHADLGPVRLRASDNLDRLDRILRYGDVFQYEELVLVLTLRVELALVQLCFERMSKPGVDGVDQADERLMEIRSTPENEAAYVSAMRAINKRWRSEVPFDLELLRIAHLLS